MVTTERDVYDCEFRESVAQMRESRRRERAHPLLEKVEVPRDAKRRFGWLGPLMHQGKEALLVRLCQQELEPGFRFFECIEEVVVTQLSRREASHRLVGTDPPRQSFEDEHDCREALLAIDDE